MSRSHLAAGLTGAALLTVFGPGHALAQGDCRQERHDNRVVGTIVGAGLGALLGNAIGQHGGKEGGTIIGGVGGAVAGNAIGAAAADCGSNRYGYYDDSGRWVPRVSTTYGYYDAEGRWVDRPYGQDNAPMAGGGPYGPPDRGGYQNGPPPAAYGQSADAGRDHDRWVGAPYDTREREAWLQRRIEDRLNDGTLDERRGRRALRELDDIRRIDADYRGDEGRLSEDQRRDINDRLDALRSEVATPGDLAQGQRPY